MADPDHSRRETDAAPAPAGDSLFDLAYDELHALAAACLRGERAGHTLQATALVHEAYLRLAHRADLQRGDRTRFLALAARAIRRALIDHARKRSARKRRGNRVTLGEECAAEVEDPLDLLALHDALDRLAELDPRQARIVELRFFGGLTVRETASVLGVSTRTVEGDWAMARTWLSWQLGGDAPG